MPISNELAELLGVNPPDRAGITSVDDPRPEVGTMVPLYTRLLRFLTGDPCGYAAPTSTGTGNIGILGNPVDARSATIFVSGGDIFYRLDGGVPNPAGDQRIQQGSTITLTGKPSILGFQFISVAAVTVTCFTTFFN